MIFVLNQFFYWPRWGHGYGSRNWRKYAFICFHLRDMKQKPKMSHHSAESCVIFSKHTIVHFGFVVAPSAFIFSGIVRIMKNSIFKFWNFGISATRWRWQHLFTFLFCLILGMFLLVSWWNPGTNIIPVYTFYQSLLELSGQSCQWVVVPNFLVIKEIRAVEFKFFHFYLIEWL